MLTLGVSLLATLMGLADVTPSYDGDDSASMAAQLLAAQMEDVGPRLRSRPVSSPSPSVSTPSTQPPAVSAEEAIARVADLYGGPVELVRPPGFVPLSGPLPGAGSGVSTGYYIITTKGTDGLEKYCIDSETGLLRAFSTEPHAARRGRSVDSSKAENAARRFLRPVYPDLPVDHFRMAHTQFSDGLYHLTAARPVHDGDCLEAVADLRVAAADGKVVYFAVATPPDGDAMPEREVERDEAIRTARQALGLGDDDEAAAALLYHRAGGLTWCVEFEADAIALGAGLAASPYGPMAKVDAVTGRTESIWVPGSGRWERAGSAPRGRDGRAASVSWWAGAGVFAVVGALILVGATVLRRSRRLGDADDVEELLG